MDPSTPSYPSDGDRPPRGAILPLVAIVGLGCLLTWAVTDATVRARTAEIEDGDARRSLALGNALQAELDRIESVVRSVAGLTSTLASHDPAALHVYYTITATGAPPLWRAVAVGPLLDRADRAGLERRLEAARAGFDALGYPEWTPTASGDDVSLFVPAVLVEPSTSRDGVFGFDMATESSRREAIRAAMRSGRVELSRPVSLSQDSDPSLRSLLLFQAYRRSTPVLDWPADTAGVVALSFTPSQLLERVLDVVDHPDVPVHLRIVRGEESVFSLGDPLPDVGVLSVLATGDTQEWIVRWQPTDRRGEVATAAVPVALGGLLVTLAGALLYARSRGEQQRLTLRLAAQAAQLRESQEAVERSRRAEALGRLTGGIAHDFNNLLSVVLGNLELLELDPNPDAHPEYREQAIAASERGARLTQQLLTLGREARLEPEPIELGQLIRDMEPLIRTSVREDVRLSLEPPTDPVHVRADRTQLESALLNLVVNARDACSSGDLIRVGAGVEDEGAHRASLWVEDTGTGMPPHVLDRATDPFFTTKEVGKGTGLGLSTARGFTRQSGGDLRIRSTLHEGTRVDLILPATDPGAPDAARTDAHPVPPMRRLEGRRVLLVEDDDRVRQVLARGLEAAGVVVVPVSNGDDARAALDRGMDVDAIVSDVVMPGSTSGPDIARIAARRGIPCVLVSGYADDLAEGGDGGAVAVLGKPVRIDRLVDTLVAVTPPDA